MKTIGIIGGMSYESTLEYYKIINAKVNERLGGLHSAKMFIESYDFSYIEHLQANGNWDELSKILIESARKLENAGADFIAIATNTMHIAADAVQDSISIPLIHIADAAGQLIKEKGYKSVALFGTKYTMTLPFYKDKLKDKFGINVIIPKEPQREEINNIIYNELCKGIVNKTSKDRLLNLITDMQDIGAQAVILGCTELPIIISDKDSPIPVIDTMEAHCHCIVNNIISHFSTP